MALQKRNNLRKTRLDNLNQKKDTLEISHIKWTAKDAFISIIFLVVVLIGIYYGLAKIAPFLKIGDRISISNITSLSFSILYGIQVLLMLGVVWFFAIYFRGSSFKDLGLTYYSIIKTIWYSILALLLIFLINFIYVFIVTNVFNIFPSDNKIEELVASKSVSTTILLIVVSIIAPFCEEIFFRGFLFQAFKKSWGTFSGLFISSFLFAAAHLELYNFIPLMAIGWILAYIFHKTKSLIPTIFLHAVYNLIMILVLFSQI
jgi:membrane protease YdiL (CAAX protease family)